VAESTVSNRLVITNDGLFTWDDVQILWEVKSSTEINNSSVLSNLILKATEVLRYQSHRQFILGFLVCGTQLRMFRFDRSGIFAGLPADFGSGDVIVLVKCILAGLVLPYPEIGILESFQSPETVLVNGNRRLVASVDDQEFVLGNQIIGPQRDHLVGQATVVHLARRIEDVSWKYCYKTSRPYSVRPHEGTVLKELKDLPCVVRLLASDTPSAATLTTEQICEDYQLHPLTSATHTMTTTSVTSSELQQSPAINDGDTGVGGIIINSNPQLPQYDPREFRQIVTEYIPESVGSVIGNDLLDLLYAWRSLYMTVDTTFASVVITMMNHHYRSP
jgi:Fungal protein kinase